MSAKNKAGSKSKDNDVYLTDIDLAFFLVEETLKRERPEWIESQGEGVRVCEPSAGDGSFVAVIRRLLPKCHITCVELRSVCIEMLGLRGADVIFTGRLERAHKEWGPEVLFDLFLGNPPYTHATSHSKICLERLVFRGHLWFLLRQAVNNAKKRSTFWDEYPSKYQKMLVERASFTGKGTDQTEYTFFEWQKGFVWPDGWERVKRVSWK